ASEGKYLDPILPRGRSISGVPLSRSHPSESADNRCLALGSDQLQLIALGLVRILGLAANIGLLNFDYAHKLPEVRIGHPGSQPMAQIEGRRRSPSRSF